ncbi:TetR/AcrR family transcriptional regulator [Sphingomonas koreensis]|nr:TetR/AcrR family transcriptional regulator [Sphingomonas koreensis]
MARSVADKKGYHHGDLRAALITEGLKLLDAGAADDLSLREVARAAGVSATAVYRHFPDKTALLEALATAGFARLAAAQVQAAEAAPDRAQGFNATGRAYVRFALAHPGLFRLMFSFAPKSDAFGCDASPTDDAMALLMANAAALAPASEGPDGARLFALRSWSLVHGLAILMLEGHVPADPALVDAAIDVRGFMVSRR